MADFLRRMADASRRRVIREKQKTSTGSLVRALKGLPPPSRLHLSDHGFDVIAEFKRRSPSGISSRRTEQHLSPAEYGRRCQRAGAAAISVITEPDIFEGSMATLDDIARCVSVPVMRKDFLVDPYQLLQARCAGASGALLIMKILDRYRLSEMIAAAAELDLFLLLEAFDRSDLDQTDAGISEAAGLGVPVLAGFNARNLKTLRVDTGRFFRLVKYLPRDVLLVAESGLTTPGDVRNVAATGYSLALVGTALMRSTEPDQLIADMVYAGRVESQRQCAFG